jgi:3-oxoacyl-[acyl-carrier protein] reductase
MDLGLKGKVAIVAASSRGLGRATAQALGDEGADIAITARHQEELDRAAREIAASSGRRVLPVVADLAVAGDIARLVQTVLDVYGRVDILVNNAGGPPPADARNVTEAEWHAAYELTLLSAVRLIQGVLPGMRERGWGRIINITSVSVKQPLPNLVLSNAIRAGVVGYAKTLANEVADEGITVNNVCPGYTLTNRVRALAEARAAAEGIEVHAALAAWESAIPARRLGRPEELAALVAFLSSEQAAYITGTTIQVDGGFIAGLL